MHAVHACAYAVQTEWVCHAINPEGPDELGETTWIQKNVARRSAVDIRTRRGEPFLLSVNSVLTTYV